MMQGSFWKPVLIVATGIIVAGLVIGFIGGTFRG